MPAHRRGIDRGRGSQATTAPPPGSTPFIDVPSDRAQSAAARGPGEAPAASGWGHAEPPLLAGSTACAPGYWIVLDCLLDLRDPGETDRTPLDVASHPRPTQEVD